MHIPDGYLSPETCAAFYAASTPFWYLALRRVKKLLNSRFLPLISVFAAFSFVIMMFNLPLPGGTTGHAVGMGIAAIVLGPSAAILAISVALVIQALFFGDGGITALGANCFNMAIAGSLVAYATYRLLAYRSGIESHRRIVAAATAGYASINVAALLAAVEFGVQPLWFHDAAGVPLYCPYPLNISVPAMMIGHLTIAGLAELAITAGVVAYLQRAEPSLLTRTASDAPDRDSTAVGVTAPGVMPSLRRFWLGLAVLLILTPLGILAAGSAWGEWAARDFADPTARREITAVSGNTAPPVDSPHGLERLSSIWVAPLARYAPPFIRSEAFGYAVSGMVGVGLIILVSSLVSWTATRLERSPDGSKPFSASKRKTGTSFVEKSLKSLAATLEQTIFAEELARAPGLLQQLDARVKVAGAGALIVTAIAVQRIWVLSALLLLAVLLAWSARVPLMRLLAKVWVPVLLFSGIIALPAIFLVKGPPALGVPLAGLSISFRGLRAAAFLILRVELTATLSALLIFTTEWTRALRALRFFRVPVTAVVVLGMTYRYVFLLLRTAQEMLESRQSRLVGVLPGSERRRVAGASVAVLLSKSLQLSGEVHDAMRARGFQGEVYLMDEPAFHAREWLQIGAAFSLAAAALLAGR